MATWLLLQIVDVLVPILTLPEWVGRFVFLILLIGFPIAVIFAWAFEMTPEGIKKESEVDRSQSIVNQTGRKLNLATIVVLSVAVPVASVPEFSEKSVAVLPFVAMSNGDDDEYFADGLTEEILNSLAQLPELLVTAHTSAFSFKGQDIPPTRISRKSSRGCPNLPSPTTITLTCSFISSMPQRTPTRVPTGRMLRSGRLRLMP